MIKLKRLRLAGHVAHMGEKRNIFKIPKGNLKLLK
jgi:hypothetical protein